MKTLCQTYSLSGSELTLSVTFPLNQESILLITDVDNNDILYNFADPTRGGVLVGNLMILNYVGLATGTTRLQIYLDDGNAPASEAGLQSITNLSTDTNALLNSLSEALNVLQRIAKNLESLQVVDANQRQRVTVDSIAGSLTLGTVTTVSTVTAVSGVGSVTSLNQLGGVPTIFLQTDVARQAFATGIRRNLTF
jgi:hypothetical protein